MREQIGFVATLDVLGFSELVYRDAYRGDLDRYIDGVNQVMERNPGPAEAVLFSDSIVLTSPNRSEGAFETILTVSSQIFSTLIDFRIPLRGSIAFGKYQRLAQPKSVFIAGRPIIEAYAHERRQKWIGIMLTDSAIREQPALSFACTIPSPSADSLTVDRWNDHKALALRLQRASRVPVMSSGDRATLPLDGYAVVPTVGAESPGALAVDLKRHLETLRTLRLEATDPGAQHKYDPTIAWLQTLEADFGAFHNTWAEHTPQTRRGA